MKPGDKVKVRNPNDLWFGRHGEVKEHSFETTWWVRFEDTEPPFNKTGEFLYDEKELEVIP